MGADTEACCFRDNSCLDLAFSPCLTGDGLPMGPGTRCGTGSVSDCRAQACCYQPSGFPPPKVCANLLLWQCDREHGTPLGRGVRCEAIADIGCIEGISGPCCLPDGTQIPSTLVQYCTAVRGSPPDEYRQCPPPPIDEDCRLPEPDREVGPTWSLELCAKVPLGPVIVPDDTPGHRAGYGLLLSRRGVRHRTDQQPCGAAATTLFLDARGYGAPMFCSQQPRFDGPHAHDGVLAVETEPVTTRVGYGTFIGAYDAPDWSETIVGSMMLRCFGDPD